VRRLENSNRLTVLLDDDLVALTHLLQGGVDITRKFSFADVNCHPHSMISSFARPGAYLRSLRHQRAHGVKIRCDNRDKTGEFDQPPMNAVIFQAPKPFYANGFIFSLLPPCRPEGKSPRGSKRSSL
jgi:hypothetical protein